MNKEEVIERLNGLDCEIAEIICDITTRADATPCYPNESILVLLKSEQTDTDLFSRHKHWAICESVDDFVDGIVYGEDEVIKARGKYYVCDFKEVKPLIN